MHVHVEVGNGGYFVACDACERSDYQDGRFVTGLELPSSMERVLQSHYQPTVLFGDRGVCPARETWTDGTWRVVSRESGETLGEGQFVMQDGRPVVDPEIEGKDAGRSWNRERVRKLAAEVIGDSEFKDREWRVNAGEHPNVVVKTKTGQAAIIPISREERWWRTGCRMMRFERRSGAT